MLLLSACSTPVATFPPIETQTPIPASNLPTPRQIATATVSATATTPPSRTPISGDSLALDVLASIGYHLPLTTQHISDHEAVFYFSLETPAPGKLFLWREGSEPRNGLQVRFSSDHAQHQIRISDLQPGTAYWAAIGLQDGQEAYLVPGLNGQQWGPLLVHTFGGNFPLRVGVLGDSGFGGKVTYDLAAAIAAMKPDLVLHTGDIVYHPEEESDPHQAFIKKYYLPMEAILQVTPLYPTIGNHELDEAAQWHGRPYYDTAFPAFDEDGLQLPLCTRWYAFQHGPVQFIILDSMAVYDGDAHRAQTSWLEERLGDKDCRLNIVVFHVPPFTSGAHKDDGAVVRRDWVPQFEAAEVPLVLSGHDHNYERLFVDGVTYVVSGGGKRRFVWHGSGAC